MDLTEIKKELMAFDRLASGTCKSLIAEVERLTANEALWKSQNEANAQENERLLGNVRLMWETNVGLSRQVEQLKADCECHRIQAVDMGDMVVMLNSRIDALVIDRVAAEVDDQNRVIAIAHGYVRQALGVKPDAPHRFDFYAQEIDKLEDDNATLTAQVSLYRKALEQMAHYGCDCGCCSWRKEAADKALATAPAGHGEGGE